MDWLLKHNLIKQYLNSNFKKKEFERAIKYTLIIGIQTLYQLHGNTTRNPHSSFSLEQLASMIVSNNGTIQVQSDLPALSQCLKDIKNQLGDIQNELDHTKKSSKSSSKSSSNSKKKTLKPNVDDTKKNTIKNKKYGSYPEWWPKDDQSNDKLNDKLNDTLNDTLNDNDPSHSMHPQIYNQPIAFSIPKEQFNKNNELHVYLYPEYIQKCLDKNEFDEKRMNKKKLNKNKKILNKKNRSKSLNRCTESSQAKTFGVRPQSGFLKANNRNVAPCLKYQRTSNQSLTSNNNNNNNNIKRKRKPKYLQNVESRIKKELNKDKLRINKIEQEKKSFLRDIARYGLDEDKNDQYIDEWRDKFGYDRIGSDEITKPSAISVADAIMQSHVSQTMDDDSINVNFLSELREWASSQSC